MWVSGRIADSGHDLIYTIMMGGTFSLLVCIFKKNILSDNIYVLSSCDMPLRPGSCRKVTHKVYLFKEKYIECIMVLQ